MSLASCAAQHAGAETDAGGADAGIVDAGMVAGLEDAGQACPGRVPEQHVPAVITCPTTRNPVSLEDGGLFFVRGQCHYDDECDGGQNGRCVFSAALGRVCSYDTCFVNGDCADAGGLCACRDPRTNGGNSCVAGNCTDDSDCGECGYCSPTMGGCNTTAGVDGYYCHTPRDECTDNSDCAAFPGTLCVWPVVGGHWVCATPSCAG